MEAQGRRDRRHLNQSEFEAAVNSQPQTQRTLEDAVLENLELEKLRKAVAELDVQDQQLISLRYDDELSMEEIGKLQNVSKMAVSKRLKKLHQKLRESPSSASNRIGFQQLAKQINHRFIVKPRRFGDNEFPRLWNDISTIRHTLPAWSRLYFRLRTFDDPLASYRSCYLKMDLILINNDR